MKRYVVELRAPKRGETFVSYNLTIVAETDYDDFPEDHRWVIVEESHPRLLADG